MTYVLNSVGPDGLVYAFGEIVKIHSFEPFGIQIAQVSNTDDDGKQIAHYAIYLGQNDGSFRRDSSSFGTLDEAMTYALLRQRGVEINTARYMHRAIEDMTAAAVARSAR